MFFFEPHLFYSYQMSIASFYGFFHTLMNSPLIPIFLLPSSSTIFQTKLLVPWSDHYYEIRFFLFGLLHPAASHLLQAVCAFPALFRRHHQRSPPDYRQSVQSPFAQTDNAYNPKRPHQDFPDMVLTSRAKIHTIPGC